MTTLLLSIDYDQFTSTNDRLYDDAGRINLSGKFSNSSRWIFVRVRIDVGSSVIDVWFTGKQRNCHCNHTYTDRLLIASLQHSYLQSVLSNKYIDTCMYLGDHNTCTQDQS